MLFYETARNNPERRRAAAAVARHLIDRDHNAALNILHRATNSAPGPGRGIGNGRGETVRLGLPSGLVEASSPTQDTTWFFLEDYHGLGRRRA